MGGGAAGLATGIFAARLMPACSVVVLDGAAKLGAKILMSGGGRCNITNRVATAADFRGGNPRVIGQVLAAFPTASAVAFFREIGVVLREEDNGKLVPETNQARTVLEALLREAARHRVRILLRHRVTCVRRGASGFDIVAGTAADAVTISAGHVVLATGGRSFPKTGSDGLGYRLATELGHSLVPLTPALVPLVLEGDFHAPLSGISHPVELTVRAAGQRMGRGDGTRPARPG